MGAKPIVSVIIPAYEAERTIKRCLDSITSQTCKSLEVIVVDDGSEDNTLAVCSKYQDIHVFSTPHKGVSSARNTGLQQAHGEYICFVDADDYFSRNDAIELLLKYPSDLVCEGDCSNALLSDYLLMPHKNTTLAFVWGKLFKRSIIEDYHIRFDIAMQKHEDTEFTFHYYFHVKYYSCIKETIYNHQRSVNGAGMKIFDSTDDCEKLLNRIRRFRPASNLINHCRISLKIVEIIRAYRLPFFTHHRFIRDLVDKKLIRDSLKDHLRIQGNSRLIPFLIKHKMYLLLTVVCRKRGKERYG